MNKSPVEMQWRLLDHVRAANSTVANEGCILQSVYFFTSSPMSTSRAVLVAALLIILVVLGAAVWRARLASTSPSPTNRPVNDIFAIESSGSGAVAVFHSPRYRFRLQTERPVTPLVLPDDPVAVLSVEFSLPNPDSGELPNRDTPNRINTSESDRFRLWVYANAAATVPSSPADFRDWWKRITAQEADLSGIRSLSIRALEVFQLTQPTGIDSTEVVYAIVTPEWGYVFSTEDFPEDTMRQFIAGFTPE